MGQFELSNDYRFQSLIALVVIPFPKAEWRMQLTPSLNQLEWQRLCTIAHKWFQMATPLLTWQLWITHFTLTSKTTHLSIAMRSLSN